MFKIERIFKPSEVIQDFHEYKEKTGYTPKIHIGTDSQIQKLAGSPAFRFVTVICLHHNSFGESDKSISKLWSLHDFQRSKEFHNAVNDPKIVKKMLKKTYIGSHAALSEDHEAMHNALAEISEMFGLEQSEDNMIASRVNSHALVMRMISEACRSIAAANTLTLRDEGLTSDNIHIGVDINGNENHLSNKALSTVKGILNSVGYTNVLWKPDSMITYAADRLSK